MIDGRGPELVRTALDLAASGDTAMLRLCIERLVAARKDSPVRVELPEIKGASDLPSATQAVLESVARGELSPSEAAAVAGLIEGHRRNLETSNLETRLVALEQAAKGA